MPNPALAGTMSQIASPKANLNFLRRINQKNLFKSQIGHPNRPILRQHEFARNLRVDERIQVKYDTIAKQWFEYARSGVDRPTENEISENEKAFTEMENQYDALLQTYRSGNAFKSRRGQIRSSLSELKKLPRGAAVENLTIA